MYAPRNILYINDYDFGDDVEKRNKYLVVLHNQNNVSVFVSLTTSKQHVPDTLLKHGCIKEETSNIHSFYFPANITIAVNGFAFELDTFIDVNKSQVFSKPIQHLKDKYEANGKISYVDTLTQDQFCDLLYCVYKSRFIPLRIKREIESVIEEIEIQRNQTDR